MSIAFGACTFTVQAANDGSRAWGQGQPTNPYWQAPGWPQSNAQRPAPSSPPVNNRQQNYNSNTPPPPPGPYRGTPAPRDQAPVQRQGQSIPQQGQRTPQQGQRTPHQGQFTPQQYRGAPAPRPPARYNEPSAFSTPGYNPYRSSRRNNSRWGSNKFWGDSGPKKWMSPNKRNWEDSWDDMINAPSRMGEMPGGWTAPEVTVPNPIDMGDQVQDNMQDLPSQMKDGNIGNDISD
ncbi:MAG: hypothetical protein HKP22_05320 [Gammaproteobacteria bacterium]|nr:hypothetical protein [Gammaproteobacteria bacterium]